MQDKYEEAAKGYHVPILLSGMEILMTLVCLEAVSFATPEKDLFRVEVIRKLEEALLSHQNQATQGICKELEGEGL